MAKEKNNPLISVDVIAYNSSEFILDLLESIKAQTYQNIELIVSDDKSSDNTVVLCEEWIEQNRGRFVRAEVLVPEHNTGTAGNYNRALFASNGEWVKFIDADDILLPNCLEDCVDYVTQTPEAKVVFSDVLCFTDINNLGNNHFVSRKEKDFFELNAYEQFKILLKSNRMPCPSAFINTQLLKENPYQEEYLILEDAPKWIDLTRKNNKFYYFDKVTAGYRNCISVSRQKKQFYSPLYVDCLFKYLWNERMALIKQYHVQDAYNYQRKHALIMELSFALFNNKRNAFNNILYHLMYAFVKLCVHYKLD